MIITTLKQYSYPQKGIITIVTELGTCIKFKGMVEMTKEGIKFYENGQEILAKH